jgi:condensin-2 complex subunit D3
MCSCYSLGFLLYQFFALTVDPQQDIAEYAKNLLKKTLSARYPDLLHKHFTEAVLLFNSCTNHPVVMSIMTAGVTASENGGEVLSSQDIALTLPAGLKLCLPLPASKRFDIYEFICNDLSDELRIQISAKLVQDILSHLVDHPQMLPRRSSAGAAAADSSVPLESSVEDVLKLLGSSLLKVGSKRNAGSGDDAALFDGSEGGSMTEYVADDISGAGGSGKHKTGKAAVAAAGMSKIKVLAALSNQHLVNHVLPVIVSLKHCLEAAKSPLQGALMRYLVHLVKSNKTEVDSFLLTDPLLKVEVEYDIKQYDRERKEKEQRELANLHLLASHQKTTAASGMATGVRPATLRKSLGGNEDVSRSNEITATALLRSKTPREAVITAIQSMTAAAGPGSFDPAASAG